MPDTASLNSVESPLQNLVAMGGPVMYVLITLAVLGLLTFFYLTVTGALFAPRSHGRVRREVAQWKQSGSHPPASSGSLFARCNPMLALSRRAMAGVNSGEPSDNLRENLALGAQKALQPFEAPLKIIEVIAALAPLLGLLGTVMGMMEAFSAMATTEGRASASQLSGGIYEALTTTAAGLVIAIPFAAIAAWAEFRLRRLNSQMNEQLLDILNAGTITAPAEARQEPARQDNRAVETRESRQPARVAHAAG
ncbi:MotA/TolQ/ExbB proton channel family protein [Marinobacter zhanjiangensis]|uniref:MotA/TolQ/ExbB proton channel domain-containing protein n=1 Tax=Marinobacter zhanjiangensis TaxID=578215 RepID=A0ABQ3ALK1_9GAMM|nr:MotA/TolQ/ExbB proton channel family protein [Marinobacter zhanjiangensis]GGY60098.1 hypothetical protein GCM10007071_03170 [Marinobacter zhanjiangensis]